MYRGKDFPNFFLAIGRVFGAEIPVIRRGKPKGPALMSGQFKRMTPALKKGIVEVMADMLVADYLPHLPKEHFDQPQQGEEQPTQKKPRQRKPRPSS